MAHPQMYDDDEPELALVRRLCLALPEAVEVPAWGRPTFRAGKIFAVYSGIETRPRGLIVKPESAEESQVLLADPRFYSPPYFGPGGWVALDLQAGTTPEDELVELIETSYRQVALKRMVRALDART